MENIKIESYELTDNELFYSGYVEGNYFFDTIDESMYLFDEIQKKIKTSFFCIESIIEDLLIADYYQFMY